ncbi:MAG: tetratricopeptide repeat protein [Planctomycetaceae bacterium]|nr:tetratricopeptide repeat protein [Planctomycetaceae bacterium]
MTASEPDTLPNAAIPLVSRSVLLAGLTLIVYQNSFGGAFHFDDFSNIVDSSAIRQPFDGAQCFRGNRPLGTWSFALNYAAGGLNPWGFHLVNVGLHLTAGLLLFGIIRRTLLLGTANEPPGAAVNLAFICTALWLVHPLTTQGVTYVVQRNEVLAALSILSALYGLIRWSAGGSLLWPGVSVVAAVAGVLSKETAVALPVVLLIYDRCFLSQSWRIVASRWPFYAALGLPMLWFASRHGALSTNAVASEVSAGFALATVTPWEYLRTQPEILLHYLRLAVWPAPLCIDYVWPVENDPLTIAVSGSIVGVLAAISVWAGLRGKAWGFLGTSFFVLLAPSSSILPIADLAAEHRMYLPLACVLTGLVMALRQGASRLPAWCQSGSQIAAVLTAAASLTTLSVLTIARNEQYRDPRRLWSSAIRVNPANPRAWQGLGESHHLAGDYEKAGLAFLQGLRLPQGEPIHPRLYAGLGDSLYRLGRHHDAERAFRTGLAESPTDVGLLTHYGILAFNDGRLDLAADCLRVAAAQQRSADADFSYGSLLIELGDYREAIAQLELTSGRWPDHLPAWRRLAWVLSTAPYESLRDGARALTILQEQCRAASSRSPAVWEALAAAYAETSDFATALKALERAQVLDSGGNHVDARAADRFEAQRRLYEQQRPLRLPWGPASAAARSPN